MLSADLLGCVIDLSDDAFIVIDSSQRIAFFNGGARRIFGYEPEEIVGSDLRLLMAGPAAARHAQHVRGFLQSGVSSRRMGERREVQGRRKSGELFPAEVSITSIGNPEELYFAAILRDATEQHRREDELRVARDLATAASDAKSEFLSHMSHELRTPLNAVIGFTELMQNELFGPVGNPKYSGYLRDIRSSAQHLLDIISDVLDMSRIESGKAQLSTETVDIGEVVAQSLNMVSDQARRNRSRFQLEMPDDLPRLMADPRAMKQIFVNLLSNAVKFSNPKGLIEVRADTAPDGWLAVAVSDTGIGIPPEDIVRVRRPFERGNNRYASESGTGLGLALVDRLVELHGGRMELVSAPGAGTVATVRFPPVRVCAPATRG